MSGQVLKNGQYLRLSFGLHIHKHTLALVHLHTHKHKTNHDTRMSKTVRFTKSTHLLAWGSGAWEVQGQGWHSLASDKGLTPPRETGMRGGACRSGRTSGTASLGTYTRLHLPRVAVIPAIHPPIRRNTAHQAHSNGQLQRLGYLKCVLTRELVFGYKQLE